MNLIPLLPVPGTPLAQISQPLQDRMQQLRQQAGEFIPQMSHCAPLPSRRRRFFAESKTMFSLTIYNE